MEYHLERGHIGPLTKAITRRIKKEEGIQRTLLLWSVVY